MRRLAMSEFTTMDWSFEQDVCNYCEAGYQGVGVVRDKVQSFGIERAIRCLKEFNMAVSDLCVAGGFTEVEPATFQEKIEDAKSGIDMAAQLEASCLIILAGPPNNLSFEEAVGLLKKSLLELVPYAEKRGVRLALEPTHPMYRAGYSFISNLDEALDICEQISSPNLGVFLDAYHIWWDNKIYDKIHRAKDRIFGVHVNDFKQDTKSLLDQGLPGEGIIPLNKLLTSIENAGWDGIYTIEVFCEENTSEDYLGLLQKAKKGFDAIWD